MFLVYGHDKTAIKELMSIMDELGIDLLRIDELPTEGRTIIEQLEHYIPRTNFGIVLATPDDEGYEIGYENRKEHRARQNVILELGMLFSKLGRSRTMVITRKDDLFSPPTDIRDYLRCEYNVSLKEVESMIKRELKKAGYNV